MSSTSAISQKLLENISIWDLWENTILCIHFWFGIFWSWRSTFVFQIWNHPDVLYEALQKENQANEQDLDLDDITSAGNTRCSAPGAGLKAKVADSSNSKVNNSLPPINPSQNRANQVITYEWVCQDTSCFLCSLVLQLDESICFKPQALISLHSLLSQCVVGLLSLSF